MQQVYGIDLTKEIQSMSWRRFVSLLAGLSAGRKGPEPISDPRRAEEIFKAWIEAT